MIVELARVLVAYHTNLPACLLLVTCSFPQWRRGIVIVRRADFVWLSTFWNRLAPESIYQAFSLISR